MAPQARPPSSSPGAPGSPLCWANLGPEKLGSFWQKRYYDRKVRDAGEFAVKLRYLHRNPVTRGLVKEPGDWEWSSFRYHDLRENGVAQTESERTGRDRELKMFGRPQPELSSAQVSVQKTDATWGTRLERVPDLRILSPHPSDCSLFHFAIMSGATEQLVSPPCLHRDRATNARCTLQTISQDTILRFEEFHISRIAVYSDQSRSVGPEPVRFREIANIPSAHSYNASIREAQFEIVFQKKIVLIFV
jgi:hypothetical protein